MTLFHNTNSCDDSNDDDDNIDDHVCDIGDDDRGKSDG